MSSFSQRQFHGSNGVLKIISLLLSFSLSSSSFLLLTHRRTSTYTSTLRAIQLPSRSSPHDTPMHRTSIITSLTQVLGPSRRTWIGCEKIARNVHLTAIDKSKHRFARHQGLHSPPTYVPVIGSPLCQVEVRREGEGRKGRQG